MNRTKKCYEAPEGSPEEKLRRLGRAPEGKTRLGISLRSTPNFSIVLDPQASLLSSTWNIINLKSNELVAIELIEYRSQRLWSKYKKFSSANDLWRLVHSAFIHTIIFIHSSISLAQINTTLHNSEAYPSTQNIFCYFHFGLKSTAAFTIFFMIFQIKVLSESEKKSSECHFNAVRLQNNRM